MSYHDTNKAIRDLQRAYELNIRVANLALDAYLLSVETCTTIGSIGESLIGDEDFIEKLKEENKKIEEQIERIKNGYYDEVI
jgi:hypothetical protein